MRAFVHGLILAMALTLVVSHGEVLFSKRMYLGESRIHTIQEGEYLSRLAQDYYGDAEYWRQLALINRAPDPDGIYPGEQILLPGIGVMNKLRQARRLSEVNSLVSLEERAAEVESIEQAREFTQRREILQEQTQPATPAPETVSEPAEETEVSATDDLTLLPDEPASTEDEPLAAKNMTPYPATQTVADSRSGGWFLFFLLMAGAGIFGYGFYLFRKHSRLEDDTELEATPIDAFADAQKDADASPDFSDLLLGRDDEKKDKKKAEDKEAVLH